MDTLNVWEGGVHHAKDTFAVCAGVPATDDRAGARRTDAGGAREFEPSAQTIRNWITQADRDAGRRSDGATIGEREELKKLRRENRRLREEREIRSKAAAWFAQETDSVPPKSSSS